MEFKNDCINIITFTGSLFYAKSQELLDEVIKVSTNSTKIIIYDFKVLLDITLKELEIYQNGKSITKYNSEENLIGLLP